jgi:hypothetical protein
VCCDCMNKPFLSVLRFFVRCEPVLVMHYTVEIVHPCAVAS